MRKLLSVLTSYLHTEEEILDDWWSDIYDGTTWQWFEEQMGAKERFIGLVVCMDMFNKSRKSTNPVQVVVMNFPPVLRLAMHIGMFLWALDKGADGALQK